MQEEGFVHFLSGSPGTCAKAELCRLGRLLCRTCARMFVSFCCLEEAPRDTATAIASLDWSKESGRSWSGRSEGCVGPGCDVLHISCFFAVAVAELS